MFDIDVFETDCSVRHVTISIDGYNAERPHLSSELLVQAAAWINEEDARCRAEQKEPWRVPFVVSTMVTDFYSGYIELILHDLGNEKIRCDNEKRDDVEHLLQSS